MDRIREWWNGLPQGGKMALGLGAAVGAFFLWRQLHSSSTGSSSLITGTGSDTSTAYGLPPGQDPPASSGASISYPSNTSSNGDPPATPGPTGSGNTGGQAGQGPTDPADAPDAEPPASMPTPWLGPPTTGPIPAPPAPTPAPVASQFTPPLPPTMIVPGVTPPGGLGAFQPMGAFNPPTPPPPPLGGGQTIADAYAGVPSGIAQVRVGNTQYPVPEGGHFGGGDGRAQ